MQHHRWLLLLGFPAAVFLLASAPGTVGETAPPAAATYLSDDETCLACHDDQFDGRRAVEHRPTWQAWTGR